MWERLRIPSVQQLPVLARAGCRPGAGARVLYALLDKSCSGSSRARARARAHIPAGRGMFSCLHSQLETIDSRKVSSHRNPK